MSAPAEPGTAPRLTIGSLFAGIGGLELGLERAGLGPVVWQVEKDDYARRVLAKHWPDATRYEDVRDVGGHNLAPVDVICGGFPCQDISAAGKGAGIRGERSGLWSEFARIAGELRPRYVVVENVAALLVRGLGVVLGDLATLGYDAWWDCLPASSVGAPHRRDRLFLVAYAAGRGQRADRRPSWETGHADIGSAIVADADREGQLQPQGRIADERRRTRDSGEDVAFPDSERRETSVTHRSAGIATAGRKNNDNASALASDGALGDWWSVEPNVGRVAHGVPARVDRLRALGNAVVPAVAEVVGRVILDLEQRAVA